MAHMIRMGDKVPDKLCDSGDATQEQNPNASQASNEEEKKAKPKKRVSSAALLCINQMTFAKYMKLLETSGSPQRLKLEVQKMY